jgi:copper homeostasis protein
MPYRNKILIEVCTDGFDMSNDAIHSGASRIELCSSLIEGGITPPLSLTEKICKSAGAPIHVMIRPRGGDFLYSDSEFELMRTDIIQAKKAGASGVVFGILLPDGSIDIKRCEVLVELALPMKCIFHRAFDMTSDPFLALEEVITLGFDTILTSGQRQTAEDGLEMIRELVKRAGDRIEIMAGGGVNSSNVMLLHEAGIRAFHFTARKRTAGKMQYRNEALQSMGPVNMAGEYDIYCLDENKLHSVLTALNEST